MKKRINPYIIPGTCMIIVLLVAISIFYHNANAGKTDPQITAQAAKDIALSDAGQKKEDVTFTKAKLDTESPAPVYEIEFYTDEKEYEYEINAQTGSVRDKECTVHQKTRAVQTASGIDSDTDSGTDSDNLQDAAKNPSNQDADSNQTGKKNSDSENDSGQSRNNNEGGENQAGGGNKNQDQKNTANTGVIGVKKAQNIALQAAGLKRKQVTFTKSKLDTDDGKNIYEIEFTKDGKEYDYDIDAYNGKILESSIDIEDKMTEQDDDQDDDRDDRDDDDEDDKDDQDDDDDGDDDNNNDDDDDDRDDDSDDDD